MRDDVSAAADPESHLLQVATSWDVVGRRPEEFPPDARTEMLARYPWLEFGPEMLANFEDQATRKPDSACAASSTRETWPGASPPTPSKAADPIDPLNDRLNGMPGYARRAEGSDVHNRISGRFILHAHHREFAKSTNGVPDSYIRRKEMKFLLLHT
jgi:hypothetical protein